MSPRPVPDLRIRSPNLTANLHPPFHDILPFHESWQKILGWIPKGGCLTFRPQAKALDSASLSGFMFFTGLDLSILPRSIGGSVLPVPVHKKSTSLSMITGSASDGKGRLAENTVALAVS
jgi:hypothetical protein